MLLSEAEKTLETRENQLEMLKEEKKELQKEIEEVTKERGKQLEAGENDFKSREKIEELEKELAETQARVKYLSEDGIDSAKEQLEKLKGKLENLEANFRDVFKVLKSLIGKDVEGPQISKLPTLVKSIKSILQSDEVDIPDSPVSMGALAWKKEFSNWLSGQNIELNEELELPEPEPNVNKEEDEVFEIFFPVNSDRNLVDMEKSKLPTNRNEDLIHHWKGRSRSAREKAEAWLENSFQYSRENDWEPAKENS